MMDAKARLEKILQTADEHKYGTTLESGDFMWMYRALKSALARIEELEARTIEDMQNELDELCARAAKERGF